MLSIVTAILPDIVLKLVENLRDDVKIRKLREYEMLKKFDLPEFDIVRIIINGDSHLFILFKRVNC
jgi:hypothetical protein